MRRRLWPWLSAGAALSLQAQAAEPVPHAAEILSPADAALMARHRGGTLRLVASSSSGTLDPQINYTAAYLQLFSPLYDQLVTYAKLEGPAGDEIVPDLAEAMPEISADGLTYVFTLRAGLRFSDGRPVEVADVAASLRRLFRVGSPSAETYYGAIAGAAACLRAPKSCVLEGVETDPATRRITIRLSRPDGEFLARLAFPHASILPRDAPDRDAGDVPLPTTGPYRIVSYDPRSGLRLERNPYFRPWSIAAQPPGYVDRIEYDFGLGEEDAVNAIERGRYDWMFDDKPQDRLGELGARMSAELHVHPVIGLYYLTLNTRIPPFDSLAARRAVGLAIDRHALTILFGGPALATPVCSMVPRPLPGSRACSDGPDLAQARRLVRESGTAGQRVSLLVGNRPTELGMGAYLRDRLQAIGWHAEVRPIAEGLRLTYAQNSDHRVQISLGYWDMDYPSPSNFLDDLFSCENYRPGSDESVNSSGLCSPELQKILTAVRPETDPAKAAALWARASDQVTQEAPAIPLFQQALLDLTSKRLGHYFYTDLYHMLFSQVWVR